MSKTKTTTAKPKRLSPGSLVVVGLAATGAGLMLIPRSNDAQNLPTSARTANTTTTNSAGHASKTKAADADIAFTAAEPTPRHAVEFYTGEVRESLFAAPQPPQPKPAPAPAPKPQPTAPVAPVVVDPFAGWVYSGTVKMGDVTMALLENSSTKDGKFVKVGEDFIGAKVESIDDRSITLNLSGISRYISKSETVNLTPLDKSAAFLQPGAQQQNQQPQPQMMNGMMMNQFAGNMNWGGDPNATYTLPNGTVLTGGAATRYQNRLNRMYNGGGGGGGRRGGGGFGGGPRGGGGGGGNNGG